MSRVKTLNRAVTQGRSHCPSTATSVTSRFSTITMPLIPDAHFLQLDCVHLSTLLCSMSLVECVLRHTSFFTSLYFRCYPAQVLAQKSTILLNLRADSREVVFGAKRHWKQKMALVHTYIVTSMKSCEFFTETMQKDRVLMSVPVVLMQLVVCKSKRLLSALLDISRAEDRVSVGRHPAIC